MHKQFCQLSICMWQCQLSFIQLSDYCWVFSSSSCIDVALWFSRENEIVKLLHCFRAYWCFVFIIAFVYTMSKNNFPYSQQQKKDKWSAWWLISRPFDSSYISSRQILRIQFDTCKQICNLMGVLGASYIYKHLINCCWWNPYSV